MADVAHRDELYEKSEATDLSPRYWRGCPPAGTERLAANVLVQTLCWVLQPQIIGGIEVTLRTVAWEAAGTPNA